MFFIESKDFIEGTMLEINNGARLVLPYHAVNPVTNTLLPRTCELASCVKEISHSIDGNPFAIAARSVAMSFIFITVPLVLPEGLKKHWDFWDVFWMIPICVFLSSFYTNVMTSSHTKLEITLVDGKKFEVTMELEYKFLIDNIMRNNTGWRPFEPCPPNRETQEQLLAEFLSLGNKS